jgi:hypothetical protein
MTETHYIFAPLDSKESAVNLPFSELVRLTGQADAQGGFLEYDLRFDVSLQRAVLTINPKLFIPAYKEPMTCEEWYYDWREKKVALDVDSEVSIALRYMHSWTSARVNQWNVSCKKK